MLVFFREMKKKTEKEMYALLQETTSVEERDGGGEC
jgi:hypothetical protein